MNEVKLSPIIFELKAKRKEVLDPSQIPVRDESYRQAFAEHADDTTEKQFAYGFSRFLAEKKILIQDEDLLAGFPFHYAYNTSLPCKMSYDFAPSSRGVYKMDLDRETADVLECLNDASLEPEMCAFSDGVRAWLYKHIHTGHFMAGYEILLEKGIGGIAAEIDSALENETDPSNRDTLESFSLVIQAASSYITRYEQLALEKCSQADSEDAQVRMAHIAKACARIKNNKPTSFFEALQLFWFGHELILAESYPTSISFGRFDYYLYPFYQADIDAGRITKAEVDDLLAAFWIKCSANPKSFQNLTLGGCGPDKTTSVNDLTYACLAITKAMHFDQPAISFRWTDDMPEKAWVSVLNLIKEGMGFPALFYDPVCMKARSRVGISDEDLYRYAMVGCVEFDIPGMEYTLTEIGRLNMPKILELMLHEGLDPVSGKTFQLETKRELTQIESFDDLFAWYLAEMEHFTALGLHSINHLDAMYAQKYPLPFLSVLMKGCVESATDVSAGGARYNNSSFNICGIATLADSLMALKRIVFEKQLVSLPEMVEILDANFEGHEDLLQICQKDVPKFGNDIDEVDSIALKIIDCFTKLVESFETPRGGKYRVGLYTVEDHTAMGVHTNATPDGRLAGEAFSNSLASVQGKDICGPTALLNSVNKFDLSKATNGMVLDLKFTPAFLENEAHCQALKYLIETYFKRGGMEIQISVVSRDTLLAAQAHPEDYQDLVVRVSGFSANFVLLQKATQDEIIKRTEITSA